MTVLRVGVLGGAGFLGSHLVDELIGRGHDLVIVDNLSTAWAEEVSKEDDVTYCAKFLKRHEGQEVLDPSLVTPNFFLGCDVIVDLALRHPLERELPLYRQALARAWTGASLVLDLLPARTLKRFIVAGSLEAVDVSVGTPLARHLRAYEGGIAYLHRPPHFDVEFVHLPELYGPRQIPETGWVAALLNDAMMMTREQFSNLGYVGDAATLLADRVERTTLHRQPTSISVSAPIVTPDDVLAALCSLGFNGLVDQLEARAEAFASSPAPFGGTADVVLKHTRLAEGLLQTVRFYEEVGDE